MTTLRQVLLITLGSALMGWGGSNVSRKLGLSGWHSGDLALFAVGIVLLAHAPCAGLAERVRRLEAEPKLSESKPEARAS